MSCMFPPGINTEIVDIRLFAGRSYSIANTVKE